MRHNAPSPTVYHEQDTNLRVVNRGRDWYFQERSHNTKEEPTAFEGTKVYDPWYDASPPQDTREAAVTIMYTRKPLKQLA